MGAMKPRAESGPLEAVKEGRSIVVRIPMADGSRLVVTLSDAEAEELAQLLLSER